MTSQNSFELDELARIFLLNILHIETRNFSLYFCSYVLWFISFYIGHIMYKSIATESEL